MNSRLFARVAAVVFCAATLGCGTAGAETWVHERAGPGDFPLVSGAGSKTAAIVYSVDDFKVVDLAAHDLAADIERVTGRQPMLSPLDKTAKGVGGRGWPLVLIGTLGHSRVIDDLVATGKLDVGQLRGAWESFVIATVPQPFSEIPSALVIAGSDRRGTAFGVYELSQAIGVSPWHWWADVVPEKKSELHVAAGTHRFGPPSVKYRGIFINDEDWGLHVWAKKRSSPSTAASARKPTQRFSSSCCA